MERVLYRISSCWLCHLQGTGHAFADVTVSTVRQLKDSDSLNVDLNTSKHHTTCKFLDPHPRSKHQWWDAGVCILVSAFSNSHTIWEIPLGRGCRSSKKSVPACHSYSSWAALASPCIPTAVLWLLPHTQAGLLLGPNRQQSLRSRAVLRRIPHTERHEAACHSQVDRDSPPFASSITFLLFLHTLESTLSPKFPSSQIISLFSFITSSQDPFIS